MLNPEADLIPFVASPLPPSSWLVFAPHSDDETFGMGGTILKASEAGIETHVVVVTDGALGGDGLDLVQVRKAEASKAGDLLGLASLTFWDVPDRQVKINEELISRAATVIKRIKPACVFFPGALEIHPDHRATGYVVWRALQCCAMEEILPEAYSYEISVQNPINVLIDISAQHTKKNEVMAIYASQNSENNYPVLVNALDKGRTFSLPSEVVHAEGFYRYSAQQKLQAFEDVMTGILAEYMPTTSPFPIQSNQL
jgi:LmbE family N-acetylglucosaminyl deacetylase